MDEEDKGKCESCEHFISNIFVTDKHGLILYGYGCELGGSYLDKYTFWNGCEYFKLIGEIEDENKTRSE